MTYSLSSCPYLIEIDRCFNLCIIQLPVINFKYLGWATCLAKNMFFDNCPKRFRGNECDRPSSRLIWTYVLLLLFAMEEKSRLHNKSMSIRSERERKTKRMCVATEQQWWDLKLNSYLCRERKNSFGVSNQWKNRFLSSHMNYLSNGFHRYNHSKCPTWERLKRNVIARMELIIFSKDIHWSIVNIYHPFVGMIDTEKETKQFWSIKLSMYSHPTRRRIVIDSWNKYHCQNDNYICISVECVRCMHICMWFLVYDLVRGGVFFFAPPARV